MENKKYTFQNLKDAGFDRIWLERTYKDTLWLWFTKPTFNPSMGVFEGIGEKTSFEGSVIHSIDVFEIPQLMSHFPDSHKSLYEYVFDEHKPNDDLELWADQIIEEFNNNPLETFTDMVDRYVEVLEEYIGSKNLAPRALLELSLECNRVLLNKLDKLNETFV